MSKASESELYEMLEYLEDATDADRIDMVKRLLEPNVTINNDDFAVYVFNNVIKPHIEDDIRLELARLHLN